MNDQQFISSWAAIGWFILFWICLFMFGYFTNWKAAVALYAFLYCQNRAKKHLKDAGAYK